MTEALRHLTTQPGTLERIDRAEVLSVTNTVCRVVLDDGLELDDVKLPDAGVILYPRVGSKVLIAQVGEDENDLAVVGCTDIDRLTWADGKLVIDISAKGTVSIDGMITLNGGKNKGLVNIDPLIVRLNALEKAINQLSTSFSGHTHIGVRGGTDSSGGTFSIAPGNLKITTASDLEDQNVKH